MNQKAYYQAQNRGLIRSSLDRLPPFQRTGLYVHPYLAKIIFIFNVKAILNMIRSHGGRIQVRFGRPWSADAHHDRAAWIPKGIGIDRALPARRRFPLRCRVAPVQAFQGAVPERGAPTTLFVFDGIDRKDDRRDAGAHPPSDRRRGIR
ncbi:hypothetical protein [Sphingomonas sp.]|uniref:hypothetical protein n=1 Tax=Sphingomonas sp. TaxID=28214 RepID=UPI0025901B39|nr:hypothetical protein [Sphingomonas sp.]